MVEHFTVQFIMLNFALISEEGGYRSAQNFNLVRFHCSVFLPVIWTLTFPFLSSPVLAPFPFALPFPSSPFFRFPFLPVIPFGLLSSFSSLSSSSQSFPFPSLDRVPSPKFKFWCGYAAGYEATQQCLRFLINDFTFSFLQIQVLPKLLLWSPYGIGQTIIFSSCAFLWSPYGIGQTIIFSCCGLFFLLLLLLFFPRLISAATDWMSTILLHMAWP